MELELVSMYSNLVWELVDVSNGIKPIGCNGSIREREGWTIRLRLLRQG